MKVVSEPAKLKRLRKPVVLAAGFFDGVHRGHQRVISTAVEKACEMGGAQAWVLTFEQHPLRIVRPDMAPPLLTSHRHRLWLLERMKLDGSLALQFDKELASRSPEEFISGLKADIPMLSHIVVGPNWRFGARRAGNVRTLRTLGRKYDFGVTAVRPARRLDEIISSTRIREAVKRGELPNAQAMLGRPFSVLGKVVHGNGLGRKLGFPTANIEVENEVLPPYGIYAVQAQLGHKKSNEAVLPGVVSFGTRPTITGRTDGPAVLELHLLTRGGNLYGRDVEVSFLKFMRNEEKYDSREALCRQMARDVAQARDVLGC